MEAIFINPNQETTEELTPKQVVEAFLDTYPASFVRDRMMMVFGMAVVGGLNDTSPSATAEEVALLFDQLIILLRAVETLHQQEKGGARYLGWRNVNRKRRRSSNV